MNDKLKNTQGLLLLIDRKNEAGMIRWIDELEKRDMPAVVLADGHSLHTSPELIKKIAGVKRIDTGISYNDGPLWEETSKEMISWIPKWLNLDQPHLLTKRDVMKHIIEHLNSRYSDLIGKTIPVFGGKYFSYCEDTLRIAEEIGIKYILSRGTEKERAVFYQPEEYKPKIISVSNVPSKTLGTGSLCDISLKNRNEKPSYFRDILFNLDVDRFVLVAQTHVSGVEDDWWNVYQDFFDSGLVQWNKLDDFVVDPRILPYKDIPVNREISYMITDLQKAQESGALG